MGKIKGRREGGTEKKIKPGQVLCGPAKKSGSKTASVIVEVADAVHEHRDVAPCFLALFVVWEEKERGVSDEPVDEEVPSWIRGREGTDETTTWCQG